MRVSVITPTANRPEMLKRCIEMFLAQDWEDKEMLIGDDYCIEHIIKGCRFQSHLGHLRSNITIGQKRNLLCSAAKGNIIIHMDDDDQYAPDWISQSVAALQHAQFTGLSSAYFASETQGYKYQYPLNAQPYILGATMAYYKSVWEKTPFKDIQTGEDAQFCIDHNHLIKPHNYINGFLASIHPGNTCRRATEDPRLYKKVPIEQINSIFAISA